MKIFICKICGHLEFTNAPDTCPVCGAPGEDFTQDDNVFIESRKKSPEAEVKHIPFVTVKRECVTIPEDSCTDLSIRIGKTMHPMVDNHFIRFIDVYRDIKYVQRIQLMPDGVFPAGCVHLKENSGNFKIVENCNIHGYWEMDVML
jgi:desulfoferrodoxin-like iron-binding protein